MNEELVISKRVSGASNQLLLRATAQEREKKTKTIQKLSTDPRIVQITSQDVTIILKGAATTPRSNFVGIIAKRISLIVSIFVFNI